MVRKRSNLALGKVLATGAFCALAAVSTSAPAQGDTPAFKIGGKTISMKEVYDQDQASFYDLEKKKFDLIDRMARERYLDHFWSQRAKEQGISIAAAQKDYEKKNVKISEKELRENLERLKNHPDLKKLSKAEQESKIRDYLHERSKRELYEGIVDSGLKKGELVVLYPMPKEPIYNVTVDSTDFVRYGPENADTKPMGCDGDKCPITVVEYSEFQCPYCSRVLPQVKQLMAEYKGKVRWIMRDFPLSFHDRAKPAAIAAKCAGKQEKFWHMYSTLFDNQRALADEDLKGYAKQIGLDMPKFESCFNNPADVEAAIDKNFRSGADLGVSGTPAFFVNGRKLSGALPYEEFKSIFDEELAKNKKP